MKWNLMFLSSRASWLKPSSISCREWATVRMLLVFTVSSFPFSSLKNWDLGMCSITCDVLYQMQRDVSWVNLPLCFPCHIFSVAYVKDRRLSGGPGTSSSLFTSDLLLLSCLMTLASWNLFLTKVGHEYNPFWAVVKLFSNYVFIYDCFLWSQRH